MDNTKHLLTNPHVVAKSLSSVIGCGIIGCYCVWVKI